MAAKIFAAVANGGILVDMIIQNAALDGRAIISMTVPSDDVGQCIELLRTAAGDSPDVQISFDQHIGKLSVVGIGLRSHTDVGARMFRTLAENSINVQMVNTSEIKVSVVVAADETERALSALRTTFDIT